MLHIEAYITGFILAVKSMNKYLKVYEIWPQITDNFFGAIKTIEYLFMLMTCN